MDKDIFLGLLVILTLTCQENRGFYFAELKIGL